MADISKRFQNWAFSFLRSSFLFFPLFLKEIHICYRKTNSGTLKSSIVNRRKSCIQCWIRFYAILFSMLLSFFFWTIEINLWRVAAVDGDTVDHEVESVLVEFLHLGHFLEVQSVDVWLDDSHSVGGERARFVRADRSRIAHSLAGIQVTHQIVVQHHLNCANLRKFLYLQQAGCIYPIGKGQKIDFLWISSRFCHLSWNILWMK